MRAFILVVIISLMTVTGRTQHPPVASTNDTSQLYTLAGEKVFHQISDSICRCFKISPQSWQDVQPCLDKGLEVNKEHLSTLLGHNVDDTSYQQGLEIGKKIGDVAARYLIQDCYLFYQLIDRMIGTAVPIVSADSLLLQLQLIRQKLAVVDTSADLHLFEAMVLYKLGRFDEAARHFHRQADLMNDSSLDLFALVADRKSREVKRRPDVQHF